MAEIAAVAPAKAARVNSLSFITAASSGGTLIEWYDFYLYGVLAGFFGSHFFPGDMKQGFLYSLGIFWTGFVFRPFGAVVFGHIGDLVGRKYTFMLTLLLMGLSTFLVGCLPTYDSIGWTRAGVACRLSHRAGAGARRRNMAALRPMLPNMHRTESADSTPAGSRPPPRWAL